MTHFFALVSSSIKEIHSNIRFVFVGNSGRASLSIFSIRNNERNCPHPSWPVRQPNWRQGIFTIMFYIIILMLSFRILTKGRYRHVQLGVWRVPVTCLDGIAILPRWKTKVSRLEDGGLDRPNPLLPRLYLFYHVVSFKRL